MTNHTKISFAKSGFRVAAAAALCAQALPIAGILLVLAEFLGIIEELPGMYKGTDTTVPNPECRGVIGPRDMHHSSQESYTKK